MDAGPDKPVGDNKSLDSKLYDLLYRAAREQVSGSVGDPVKEDLIVDRLMDRWSRRSVDGNPPENPWPWLRICLYRAIARAATETAKSTFQVDDLATLVRARDRVESSDERAEREEEFARQCELAEARLVWLRENLDKLLEQLSPRQAESLEAWLRLGTYHAAARETGIPRSNLRRAVAGALEKLPKIVEEILDGDPPPPLHLAVSVDHNIESRSSPRWLRATRPSIARRRRLVAAFSVFVLLSTAGCAESPSTVDSQAVCIDLGALAPRVSIGVRREIPSVTTQARLHRLSSSCECANVHLLRNGRRIGEGELVTPQDALSVDLDFAPNAGPQHPQHGVRKVHQKVVATFSAQGRTRWLEREVQVTCQLDQTQSVLRENEIRGEVVLPQSVLWVPIRLKKAIAGVSIEVDAGSTSWITPLVGTFERSLEVPVKLGPFETPGKYESSVRLRVRARHFETVPVHVNVFSQFDVRPRRLVITMNPNESHTIKLEFRGPRSPLIRPSIRNLDTASPSLRLVLGEPTPLVGAEGEQHVAADLLVRSDDMPTVHEGRVLLCPHPEATYSLPFDYVVRVSRR